MSQRKAGLIAGAVSLCLTTFAGAVLAADKSVYAYQGISVTRTTAKDGCQSIQNFTSLTGSCNDTATRWKIFGGYRVHRNIGLEVTYADLGRTVVEGKVGNVSHRTRAKAAGIGLSAVGYFPVNDDFSFFAKAGAMRWKMKADISSPKIGSAEGSESGVGLSGGIGASYFFTPEIGVLAEYEVIKGVGDKNGFDGSDVQMMSVGVMMRF